MEKKNTSIRLSMDMPEELHQELKVISAAVRKSMRELVTEAIKEKIQSLLGSSGQKVD